MTPSELIVNVVSGLVVALLFFHILHGIGQIGKPREPMTADDAVGRLLWNAVIIGLLIYLWAA